MKRMNRYAAKAGPVPWWTGTLFALLLLAGNAYALGTPAGTVIDNVSTGTYTDANNNSYAAVTSNSVSTTVSQVAGLNVTPTSNSQNGIPGGTTNYSLVITNTGNGSDSFTFSSSGLPAGWSAVIYKDLNGDGLLTTADQVSGSYVVLTSPVALAADQSQYAIVVVTAPAGATAGTSATLNVSVASTFNPASTQTVTTTTTIQAAVMTVTKSASPTNPKPGDTVTYTINYSNIGSAPAYLAVLSDAIPANTTYKAESITVGGATRTDLGDGDNADYNVTSPGKVTVNLGTVAAGASGIITFQVQVNSGIAATTVVSNSVSLSYQTSATDPATATTVSSNSTPFTVAQKSGMTLTPATVTTNQLVGDLNQHAFVLTNTGNGSDTYNFASVGLYWTWTLYHDVDANGQYTTGIDTLLTDTNGDGKIDSGLLAAGAAGYYIATTTVSGYNGQQGQHTLTATSVLDPTNSATSIKYTNIQTPVIALVKSVSPTGPQPPGTVLTYTINVTNSGAATAQSFVVTDVLSTYLSYVAESIVVGSNNQSDANDSDFGRYDGTSGTVMVSLPTISPGATVPISFRTTIK